MPALFSLCCLVAKSTGDSIPLFVCSRFGLQNISMCSNTSCLAASRVGSQGERTPARLLEASLRMRPDRIILGELRGEESRTFREATNTGHGGPFTPIHADTARKAIDRLEIMVMAARSGMGFEKVKLHCEESVDLVVQLSRQGGRRGVAEIVCP
jgi:type IV secretion system protein VirB11